MSSSEYTGKQNKSRNRLLDLKPQKQQPQALVGSSGMLQSSSPLGGIAIGNHHHNTPTKPAEIVSVRGPTSGKTTLSGGQKTQSGEKQLLKLINRLSVLQPLPASDSSSSSDAEGGNNNENQEQEDEAFMDDDDDDLVSSLPQSDTQSIGTSRSNNNWISSHSFSSTVSVNNTSQTHVTYHLSEKKIIRQLQVMLNLNPTMEQERCQYNDELMQLYIENYPEVFRKRQYYPLQQQRQQRQQGGGGEASKEEEEEEEEEEKRRSKDPDCWNYPLWRICTLGPSLATVQACFRACPSAVTEASLLDGTTPLHNAVLYGATKDVLRFLMTKGPSLTLQTNHQGQIPLHLAIANHTNHLLQQQQEQQEEEEQASDHSSSSSYSNLDVIETLTDRDLTSDMDSSLVADHKPWFYACMQNNAQVLSFMLERYPLAPDHPALMKLLVSAMEYCSLELLTVLIEMHPTVLTMEDDFGRVALHRVLDGSHSDPRLVELCYSKCPEAAASCVDRRGRLPFHYATAERSIETVRLLWEDDSLVSRRDHFGRLPLHYAAGRNPSLEVSESLLRAFPNAARTRDRYGKTPLHYAAERGADGWPVARLLMDCFPDAVKMTDANHQTPLHHAVHPEGFAPSCIDTVRRLLDIYPGAVRIKDRNGQVPLHLAVSSVDPVEEVVQALVSLYPIGIKVPDRNHNTPGDFAQMRPTTSSIAGLFFTQYPSLKSLVGPVHPVQLVPHHMLKPAGTLLIETHSGGGSGGSLRLSLAESYDDDYDDEDDDDYSYYSRIRASYDSSVVVCLDHGINHEEKAEV